MSPGQFEYNLIMAPKSILVRWPDTRIPGNNELAKAAGAAERSSFCPLIAANAASECSLKRADLSESLWSCSALSD